MMIAYISYHVLFLEISTLSNDSVISGDIEGDNNLNDNSQNSAGGSSLSVVKRRDDVHRMWIEHEVRVTYTWYTCSCLVIRPIGGAALATQCAW